MPIALRRRGSLPFLLGFWAFGSTALALYISAVSLFAEDLVIPFRERILKPLVGLLRDGPYVSTADVLMVYFIASVILVLPQLAFAMMGDCLTLKLSRPGP
jgi:hypothetical protein